MLAEALGSSPDEVWLQCWRVTPARRRPTVRQHEREASNAGRNEVPGHPDATDSAAALAIPADVRALLDAPNYVRLATLRSNGSPRNHAVWVGLEGDSVLVSTFDFTWKAKDMRRDPRVALSIVDLANPYRMAMLQGRVVEERPDQGCRHMDPISVKSGRALPQPRPRPRVFRDRGRASRRA